MVLSPWQCFMCDTSVNPACPLHNDTDYRHWREDSNYNCLYRPIMNYGMFKTTYLWFTGFCVLTMCYIRGPFHYMCISAMYDLSNPRVLYQPCIWNWMVSWYFLKNMWVNFVSVWSLWLIFFSCKHVCIFNNIHAIEIWVEMTLAWHSDRRIL